MPQGVVSLKKIKKIENEDAAYKAAIENESILDVADRCTEFRNAKSTISELETIDVHYQYLFDRVVDSLIVTYDSGGICPTMEGLRNGMHQRRRQFILKG
jgi:hypothetical protein